MQSNAYVHTHAHPQQALSSRSPSSPLALWPLARLPLQEYEGVAVLLAQQPHLLLALRHRIVAGRAANPLFHPHVTTRHLERAYQCMWDVHLAQLVGRHVCGQVSATDRAAQHMRAPQPCWTNNATLAQYRECMHGWHPLHVVVDPAAGH